MTIRCFDARLLPASARRPALLRRACRLALGPAARRPGELNVIFTTNAGIRRVNRRYLGHDRSTDVIAFNYSRVPGAREKEPPFGDVYVSVDQARRQAAAEGHDLLTEVLTLVMHGTLHLVGYRDNRPALKRRMFARQYALLRRIRA